MQYEIGIACRPNYLRPSLALMHGKIVERDNMDEVVEYLESILNNEEMMQYEHKYWSYMDWSKIDESEGPGDGMRFGVMQFKSEDGYEWSIDIGEYQDEFKDDYICPKFKYMEMD